MAGVTVLHIHIPGTIRGKGRPKFSARNGFARAYTDAKTANAETWIRTCAIDQVGTPVLDGPISLAVSVAVEIPMSKSRKWKLAALAGDIRPTGKPDFDNTVKLLCDALNKIVWRDDAQITDVTFSKRYADIAGATLIIQHAIED